MDTWHKRAAIGAALVLLTAGILLRGSRDPASAWAASISGNCSSVSAAQVATCSFATSTPVAPGGTLSLAISSPAGATLGSASVPDGCAPASSMAVGLSFTCSSGLQAGATIGEQVYLPSQGASSIAESVIYNANGPEGLAASSLGVCAAFMNNQLRSQERSTCSNTAVAPTSAPNSLVLTIGCGALLGSCLQGSSLNVSAPSMAGFCPLAGITGQSTPGPVAVTYTCSGGETIAQNTTVVVGVFDAGSDTGPGLGEMTVANAGGSTIPSPTTDQVTFALPGITVTPIPATRTVTYAAGFNLVGGPAGTLMTGASGPLYTFQPSDTSYETLSSGTPLADGLGYWAYFPSAATVVLPAAPPPVAFSIPLPAGRFVMVGNPSDVAVTLSGADAVYTYSLASGYGAATVLCPGAGAWAYSARGGSLILSAPAGSTTCG